ncbi:MAG: hypothetical protein AAF399_00405 [Bacteroidota bacterium]
MRFSLLLITCCTLSPWLIPQASAQLLFESNDPLEMTLTVDITALQGDRGSRPSYHKARLAYTTPEGEFATAKLKVKARGAYRLDPYICDFPPLRFNFDKDDNLPAPFTGQNKLKVVTHCHEDQYIFREYYLYRAYNLFTDKSFRVRLAKITYEDSKGVEPAVTRWAFFIESEKNMAARNEATSLSEDIVLQPEEVDREQLTLCHLFNYMIANRDFRVSEYQNLKIITNGSDLPVVVPYDFDWSGMVDAPYTKRRGDTKPSYEERQMFRPLCRDEAEYQAMIQRFEEKRGAIEALYETSPYLDDAQKKESLKYYKKFYKSLGKSKTMKEVFLAACNQ